MSVTIVDIAKEANLTHGTVSRALRSSPRVSIKTRSRVLRIAERMGYRPHHFGRALKSGKTNVIGIVVPDLINPFYVELLRSLQNACLRRGYEVFCVDYALDHKREIACLEQMLGKRCDGVITVPSRFDSIRGLLDEFWESGIPCVSIGLPRDIGELRIDGINVAIESGIEASVKHLVSLGHKKIVFAGSWSEDSFNTEARFGAFEKIMNECGLEYAVGKNALYRFSGNQIVDGRLEAEKILEQFPETTAIIATNDYMALGLFQTLSLHGVRVPEDISIIGSDSTWIGESWVVPLTSIDQRTAEQTEVAVDMLFSRLDSSDWGDPKHVDIHSTLNVRKSTGPVRTTSA